MALRAAEDPEVLQARVELDRVQGLVESGALPRVQLEKSRERLADAEDGALLRQSTAQADLTEAQADELVAAASRRFERRKKAFDEGQKLVEAGVEPSLSLDTLISDLAYARLQAQLADSRARLTHEMAQQAELEHAFSVRMQQAPDGPRPEGPPDGPVAERFDRDGVFTPATFRSIESAFEAHFNKPLPVSAMGETAVHRALGFDHRGRVDVALQPDQPEGIWLREYLIRNHIPFFAFRQAVAGKATGAHIHLGPMSTRLATGG
jgi:hypothetical protein